MKKNINKAPTKSASMMGNKALQWSIIGVLALLVMGAAAFSIFAGAGQVEPGRFSDVPANHYAYDHIKELVEAGIIFDFDTTECDVGFCADEDVDRKTVAVWLVGADGIFSKNAGNGGFEDVPITEWWAPYVGSLVNAGITNGCSQEPARFCPDAPVSRKHMALFIDRAFLNDFDTVLEAGFTDIAGEGQEATNAINKLYSIGITTGCSQDPLKFCPNDNITRAQAATMINRAISNIKAVALRGEGNQSPSVRYLEVIVSRDGSTIKATANKDVPVWKNRIVNVGEYCGSSTFTSPPNSPDIDYSDTRTLPLESNQGQLDFYRNKVVCFQASSNTGEQAYGWHNMDLGSDLVITINSGQLGANEYLQATADESVTWRVIWFPLLGMGGGNYDNSGFTGDICARYFIGDQDSVTGSSLPVNATSGRVFFDSNHHDEYTYYCFEATDVAGNRAYLGSYNSLKGAGVFQSRANLYASFSVTSGEVKWLVLGPLDNAGCDASVVERNYPNKVRASSSDDIIIKKGSQFRIILTEDDHDKYYCFRAQEPISGNYSYAGVQVDYDLVPLQVDIDSGGTTDYDNDDLNRSFNETPGEVVVTSNMRISEASFSGPYNIFIDEQSISSRKEVADAFCEQKTDYEAGYRQIAWNSIEDYEFKIGYKRINAAILEFERVADAEEYFDELGEEHDTLFKDQKIIRYYTFCIKLTTESGSHRMHSYTHILFLEITYDFNYLVRERETAI